MEKQSVDAGDAANRCHEQQTAVALKHLESCRQEIVERLKMREQIVLAYVAAVAALIGYAAKPSTGPYDYDAMLASGAFQLLVILLPLLSLYASYSVALHQEQIQAFAEYLALDLSKYLPAGFPEVPIWEHSRSRTRSTRRILKTVLAGQLVLLCGPWLVVMGLYVPYLLRDVRMTLKDVLFVPGVLIAALCVRRLWLAWRFRTESDKLLADAVQPAPHS